MDFRLQKLARWRLTDSRKWSAPFAGRPTKAGSRQQRSRILRPQERQHLTRAHRIVMPYRRLEECPRPKRRILAVWSTVMTPVALPKTRQRRRLHSLRLPRLTLTPAVLTLWSGILLGCGTAEYTVVRPGSAELADLALTSASRPVDIQLASGRRLHGYLLFVADSAAFLPASAADSSGWYPLESIETVSTTSRDHRRGFLLGAAAGIASGLVAVAIGVPSCSDGSGGCTFWQSAGVVAGSGALVGALGWSFGTRKSKVYRLETHR